MNFKHILSTVVAGASLLTMVGSASAISGDINIYGASAQFNFWKAQGGNFLGGNGCTVVGHAQYNNTVDTADSNNKKHWITKATCGSTTVYFRSSSKASYDGPLAIQNNTTNPNRTTSCSDARQRKMLNEAAITTWGTLASPTNVSGSAALTCKTVTGGASDVEVTSFDQVSHGMLLGPSTATNNVFTDRDFTGSGAITAEGLSSNCRTLVVPFAFFLNNSVTKGGVAVNNITTAEARLIFSGQVADWSDLGYDAKAIRACWRHAGSGTAAALDFDVMRPAALAINEDTLNGYEFWFNDGSADLMACVNASGVGGIGYADADQALSSYPNVHRLSYNGYDGSKANITKGVYDFYTVQNLYTVSPRPADMETLCTFMKKPANNINPNYANTCEMKYSRSDDRSSPMINGDFGSCPQ